MKKFIISAPFGNHINWKNATSTVGTFTYENRAGFWKRWWRVLSTVRFYPAIGACVNKLGLPNSGLASYLVRDKFDSFNKIISISSRKTDHWIRILQMLNFVPNELIELNVSCPNCPSEKDETDCDKLFSYIQGRGLKVGIKIPPVGYESICIKAAEHGIKIFHCTNTLSTPAGGLSGKPLQLLALNACRFLKDFKDLTIIGGGGITSMDDVKRFEDAGATHFAVASAFFNPFRWRTLYKIAEELNDKLC